MEDSLLNLGMLMGGIISLVPEVLIFIAILFYLSKEKSSDAILMIIGSSIGIIMTIYSNWIFPLLLRDIGSGFTLNMYQSGIVSILYFIGSFSFAIGFFLMLHKLFKKGKSSDEQLISRIEKINDPND